MFSNKIENDKLHKCMNEYDIIALAASLIDKNNLSKQIIKIKDEEKKALRFKIYKIIVDYTYELRNNQFSQSFFQSLIYRLKEIKVTTYDKELAYFVLIKELDAEIKNFVRPKKIGYKEQFKALNNNFEDTGYYVIPRIKTSIRNIINCKLPGELRKRMGANTGDIDLKNAILCQKGDLEGLDIQIVSICNYESKSNHIERFKLGITIVPFTSKKIENILNIMSDSDHFWIEDATEYGVSNEYVNRYKKAINKSLQNDKTDIIVFPEMILTKKIKSQLKNMIRAEHKLDFKLIHCGTMPRSRENQAVIFDNKGNLLCEQYKMTPFTNNDGKQELLSPQNMVYILDISDFGRVMFCICKDIMNMNIRKLIKIMEADILLISAFSSSNDINNAAKNMSCEDECLSVLCNSCSALNDCKVEDKFWEEKIGKTVGFINVPGKKGSGRGVAIHEVKINECCNECSEDCSLKGIEISLNEYTNYGDVISCKIETFHL